MTPLAPPVLALAAWSAALLAAAGAPVSLRPPEEPAGYLARLLVNETPFPGERGYVSEADAQATMRALLLVLDARARRVPPGYTRREVAATDSDDLLDIMTAGGARGQLDGFFRDARGRPAMAARVTARVDNLLRIAAQGEPGRFARLLAYAQALATGYVEGVTPAPDLFAALTRIPPKAVTGRAYGWMTDQDYYHPGGTFVRIPNHLRGRLGGNRFYTLERRDKPARAASPAGPIVNPTPRD